MNLRLFFYLKIMKNTKNLFVVFILSGMFLFSCAPGEKKAMAVRSSEIINPDSIVNIITEIHIAEAMLRELKTDPKEKEKTAEAYFSQIFNKHSITREQYEKSIAFYQEHLEEYQDIYERVITLLSQKQSENTSEEKEE